MDSRIFDDLRRQAEELSRRVTVPPDQLAGCTGSDQTKSVTAVLNGRGRVSKLTVHSGWRDSLRPHQLAPAILEAISAAERAHVTAWADASADRTREAPAPPPPTPATDWAEAPFANHTPTEAVQELFGLLENLEKEIESTSTGLLALSAAKIAGSSAGRHVTVTLTGKRITGITIDDDWAGYANHQDISGELRGALRAAYEKSKRHAADTMAASVAPRIRRLMADPAALIRGLGLA